MAALPTSATTNVVMKKSYFVDENIKSWDCEACESSFITHHYFAEHLKKHKRCRDFLQQVQKGQSGVVAETPPVIPPPPAKSPATAIKKEPKSEKKTTPASLPKHSIKLGTSKSASQKSPPPPKKKTTTATVEIKTPATRQTPRPSGKYSPYPSVATHKFKTPSSSSSKSTAIAGKFPVPPGTRFLASEDIQTLADLAKDMQTFATLLDVGAALPVVLSELRADWRTLNAEWMAKIVYEAPLVDLDATEQTTVTVDGDDDDDDDVTSPTAYVENVPPNGELSSTS